MDTLNAVINLQAIGEAAAATIPDDANFDEAVDVILIKVVEAVEANSASVPAELAGIKDVLLEIAELEIVSIHNLYLSYSKLKVRKIQNLCITECD